MEFKLRFYFILTDSEVKTSCSLYKVGQKIPTFSLELPLQGYYWWGKLNRVCSQCVRYMNKSGTFCTTRDYANNTAEADTPSFDSCLEGKFHRLQNDLCDFTDLHFVQITVLKCIYLLQMMASWTTTVHWSDHRFTPCKSQFLSKTVQLFGFLHLISNVFFPPKF